MLLLLLAGSSLAAWGVLALARRGFWLASERLEPVPAPPAWPAVAAVIPARDEAASIGQVIAAHAASDYPGPFRVVVVDDHSSDGTADIARAAASGRDVRVLAAPPLASGWSGKLNAVAAGVASVEAMGDAPRYLLLTDADIVLAPDTLRRLVALAEAEELALASLMARLDSRGLWGALLIPAFVYFFQKLYPFPAINDPASRIAGAAGGCMLVRREALAAAGGVAAIRGRLIDDCALAAMLKQAGGRIWLGLARHEARSLRDNRSLGSIWTMVARTAFAQLGRSWAMLAGAVAGMAFVYLVPPVATFVGLATANGAAAAVGFAAWSLMAFTYGPTVRLYDQPRAAGYALPAAAFLYTVMTIDSGLRHARGRGGAWKGRTYEIG